MVALTMIMGGTGTLMKYPSFFSSLPFIDLGLMRAVHNMMSIYFSIVLSLMMLTGLYMYLFPYLRKKPALQQVMKPAVQSEPQPTDKG
jgi:hypothetical protein